MGAHQCVRACVCMPEKWVVMCVCARARAKEKACESTRAVTFVGDRRLGGGERGMETEME